MRIEFFGPVEGSQDCAVVTHQELADAGIRPIQPLPDQSDNGEPGVSENPLLTFALYVADLDAPGCSDRIEYVGAMEWALDDGDEWIDCLWRR